MSFKFEVESNIGSAEYYRFLRHTPVLEMIPDPENPNVVRWSAFGERNVLEADFENRRLRSLTGNGRICFSVRNVPPEGGTYGLPENNQVYNIHIQGLHSPDDTLRAKYRSIVSQAVRELGLPMKARVDRAYLDHDSPVGRLDTRKAAEFEHAVKQLQVIEPKFLLEYARLKHITGGSYNYISFDEYSWFWQNHDKIDEVREKMPAAIPHFDSFINHNLGRSLDPKLNLMQALPEYIKRIYNFEPKDWKLYLKLTEKQRIQFRQHKFDFGNNLLLQVFRETGRFPKVTACKTVDELWKRPHVTDWGRVRRPRSEEFLKRLIYVALVASTKAVSVTQWSRNEFIQVRDWFHAAGWNMTPDKNQLTMSWGGFVRRSEAWHQVQAEREVLAEAAQEDAELAREAARLAQLPEEERAAIEANPAQINSWVSLVGEIRFESINMRVVALNTRHSLKVEGVIQKHCVGSYSSGCIAGDSRIFSLRALDTDNRLATIQLTQNKGDQQWRCVQIRGKNNAEVDDTQKAVGNAVAAAYNREQKRVREEARERERLAKIAEEEAKAAAKRAEQDAKMEEASALLIEATISRAVVDDAEMNHTNVVVLPVQPAEQPNNDVPNGEGELARAV